MLKSLFVSLLILAPTGAAAQPFSTSMAQCAGIYDSVARFMTDPNRQAELVHAAADWLDAARVQAVGEGVVDPEKTVHATYRVAKAEWEAKGMRIVFSQEFRDWTAYCRSFAADRGIELGL
tara:strand:+ start:50958 stop:51320 length:363 start_codon:yes stop_codon:yes gene_type:complete